MAGFDSDSRSVSYVAKWYRQKRPVYEALTAEVCHSLEALLLDRGAQFLSVSGRTKSEASLIAKAARKTYRKPEEQIHDFSGIRVITFVESDAALVAEVISSAFRIHPDKSPDKSAELGTDRIGYRSRHFVCELGGDRIRLAEYRRFKSLLFEIQVRTVLQHAWAEIEHDRGYKLGGVLPPGLARRFNLAAGLLEVADREFDQLASEIDSYGVQVSEQTSRGYFDIDINSTSLLEYLRTRFEYLPEAMNLTLSETDDISELVEELQDFGAASLADLDRLVSSDFIKSELRHPGMASNQWGFIRDAMMFDDLEKYFSLAWNRHWWGLDDQTREWLNERHGSKLVARVIDTHGLQDG